MTVQELIEELQECDPLAKVEVYVEEVDTAYSSISVDASATLFGIVYLNV